MAIMFRYSAQWIYNDLDLTFQCYPKSHVIKWNKKQQCDLMYNYVFHACKLGQMINQLWGKPLESYITFSWPLKVIQGQMSWCRLKYHIWFRICLS